MILETMQRKTSNRTKTGNDCLHLPECMAVAHCSPCQEVWQLKHVLVMAQGHGLLRSEVLSYMLAAVVPIRHCQKTTNQIIYAG